MPSDTPELDAGRKATASPDATDGSGAKRYGLSSWTCAQEWGAPWDYGPGYVVPFVLASDYDSLRADVARLQAQLEVSEAASRKAVSKAEWQARTNHELNELRDERDAMREALERIRKDYTSASIAYACHDVADAALKRLPLPPPTVRTYCRRYDPVGALTSPCHCADDYCTLKDRNPSYQGSRN